MSRADARITLRVDETLKEEAELLYERLGINMSVAINMFLRKSVNEGGIPFSVSERAGTQFSADEITASFRSAVRDSVADHRKRGLPVAKYDPHEKQAYLEYADGRREYVNIG